MVQTIERLTSAGAPPGTDGVSRRSTGNRWRSVGTLEPRPASGPLRPEQLPDLRAAPRWQRPHVLQPEVAGGLVAPPGTGGVRDVREPHSWTFAHTVGYIR
jgi:hypothetical protein